MNTRSMVMSRAEGSDESVPLLPGRGEEAAPSGITGVLGVGKLSAKRVTLAIAGMLVVAAACVGVFALQNSSAAPFVSSNLGDGDVDTPALGEDGEPDLGSLPDVDFTGKTLLIVMGLPFSGTSALEGLLGTAGVITDLCKANTWQCEDTQLLQDLGFKRKDSHCDCCDEELEDVTVAEYAYAFKDFAHKWWDMSKPVLMDKTPNLICRHRKLRDAAAMLGLKLKFIVLTHHPFSWNSDSHPFNEGWYSDAVLNIVDVLSDNSVDVLQVKYELMAWRTNQVIEEIKRFVPEITSLDPWRSGLAGESSGDRGSGVAEFFKAHPLEWVIKKIQPSTMQSLCRIGYNTEGECSAF